MMENTWNVLFGPKTVKPLICKFEIFWSCIFPPYIPITVLKLDWHFQIIECPMFDPVLCMTSHNIDILQWQPMKVIQIPSVWKRKENDHQILFMVTKCTDKSFCIHWILCSWRFYEPRPRIFYVNMFCRIHYKDRLESIFACSFIQGE